jgi:hypothetical protein
VSGKIWTRESLTEQILADTAGLWKHIEAHQRPAMDGKELFAGVKGGCVALIEGRMVETTEMLTLAVAMLHTIRELLLEEQAKDRAAS